MSYLETESLSLIMIGLYSQIAKGCLSASDLLLPTETARHPGRMLRLQLDLQ